MKSGMASLHGSYFGLRGPAPSESPAGRPAVAGLFSSCRSAPPPPNGMSSAAATNAAISAAVAAAAQVDFTPSGAKRPRATELAAAVTSAVHAALQEFFDANGEKEGSPYVVGFAPPEDPSAAAALASFKLVDADASNLIDERELQAALSGAGGGPVPLSLCRLIVRVFDANSNGGLDWDEYRVLHGGISSLMSTLFGLVREHAAAGLSSAEPSAAGGGGAGAPQPGDFFFTREELASFLETAFGGRGPAVRQLAMETALWSDSADGVPRLHFPSALRLVVQRASLPPRPPLKRRKGPL